MSYNTTRRELLMSSAAIAASPAIGLLAPDLATAQTAGTTVKPASISQIDAYMGAPVELGTAPNGAITNKKLLDGIGKVAWAEPTI
jgi:hypothetical protein